MADKTSVYCVWILSVLLLVVIVAIIVVAVLANDKVVVETSLNAAVDVVLIDRGRKRNDFQITMVDLYMPWVNSIVVVYQTGYRVTYPTTTVITSLSDDQSKVPVYYISHPTLTDTAESIFVNIGTIYADIAERVIFLSDNVFPIAPVEFGHMISSASHRRRRVFNYIQTDAKVTGFVDRFELTLPAMMVDVERLSEASNISDYILSEILLDTIVYAPGINKPLVLMGNPSVDTNQIRDILVTTSRKKFATVSIDPGLDINTRMALNQDLVAALNNIT
jgi:hypothetical protein